MESIEKEKQERLAAMKARLAQAPRAVQPAAVLDPRTAEEQARDVAAYMRRLANPST